MSLYDDPLIALDEDGIIIKSYWRPGNERRIAYGDVRAASRIPIGFWTGRARLVGIGFGRPFHFFHWDRHRGSKQAALSLELGRMLKTAITPDEPDRVLELISERIG